MALDRSLLIYAIIFLTSLALFCTIPLKNEYLYKIIADAHNATKKSTSCSNSTSSDVDVIVTKEVSRWSLLFSITMLLPASIASILITSLGDRVGRKIAIFIPVFGMFFSNLSFLLVIYFKWSLLLFLIFNFLSGLSGYYMTMMTQGMAYLSDITETEKRGRSFVILETALGIGAGVAGIGGGYWLKASGFIPPVLCSCILQLLATSLIFFVPTPTKLLENRKRNLRNEISSSHEEEHCSSSRSSSNSYESIINTEKELNKTQSKKFTVLDLLRSVWRVYSSDYSQCESCCEFADQNLNFNSLSESKNHGCRGFRGRTWRMWLYLLIDNLYMFVLVGIGEFQIIYFLAKPLCFTPTLIGGQLGLKFILYSMAPLMVFIYQKLSFSNNTIAFTGLLGLMAYSTILSFASTPSLVFIGTGSMLFVNTTRSFIYAQVSKMVLNCQQGAAYALLSSTENLTYLLAGIAFLAIYPATLQIYRGFVWLFGAVVLIFPLIFLLFIVVKDRSNNIQDSDERKPLLT